MNYITLLQAIYFPKQGKHRLVSSCKRETMRQAYSKPEPKCTYAACNIN